jgi:3-oxoacyl-[acyl-carrier-protein] synthase II
VAANDVRKVPADHIERTVVAELGLCRAESFVNGAACAASNQALGLAVDAIMSGDAEFALAGGADALCQRAFAAFTRLNLMAPELCQPFDISRKGLLLGEGAAMLVLEDLERARSRGARVYAEVLGYAANCDRRHAVQPDAESLAECMRTGLERAGLRPGQVDLICAHGSGTPTNDLVESEALRAVFVDPPPVTAVKSMLGHTMGAAGGMGALAGLAAIGAQEIPPTINHVTTDPSCALDCVAGQSRPQSITVVQNNALGFFGNNAVTFFKRLSEVA